MMSAEKMSAENPNRLTIARWAFPVMIIGIAAYLGISSYRAQNALEEARNTLAEARTSLEATKIYLVQSQRSITDLQDEQRKLVGQIAVAESQTGNLQKALSAYEQKISAFSEKLQMIDSTFEPKIVDLQKLTAVLKSIQTNNHDADLFVKTSKELEAKIDNKADKKVVADLKQEFDAEKVSTRTGFRTLIGPIATIFSVAQSENGAHSTEPIAGANNWIKRVAEAWVDTRASFGKVPQ